MTVTKIMMAIMSSQPAWLSVTAAILYCLKVVTMSSNGRLVSFVHSR